MRRVVAAIGGVIAVAACGASGPNTTGAQERDPMADEVTPTTRLELEQLHTHEPLPAQLEDVTATVDVRPEQTVRDGGLSFSLRVRNDRTHAIAVSNPYELLTYKLTNADGWPIAQRAPSAKSGKVRRGPVATDRGGYLRLVSARVGGEDVDATAPTAALPPSGELTYDLRVETIVAPPNADDGPTAFVAGSYGFKCQLALLVDGPDGRGGATLVTPEITIVMR